MSEAYSMQSLLIDISDQHRFVRDEIGREFADLEAAKDEAVTALPDMAREALLDGDARIFLAIVGREYGRTLIQATLMLAVKRMTREQVRAAADHP